MSVARVATLEHTVDIRQCQALQYANALARRERSRAQAASRLANETPGNICHRSRYDGSYDRHGKPTNLEQAACRYDRELVRADSRLDGQSPLTRSQRRRQHKTDALQATVNDKPTTITYVRPERPDVCPLNLASCTVYANRKSQERLAYEVARIVR